MGPTRRESSSWSCSELWGSHVVSTGLLPALGERMLLRCRGADVGQLPFEVLLQWFQAFEGDLELVRVGESSGIVAHCHVEKTLIGRSVGMG